MYNYVDAMTRLQNSNRYLARFTYSVAAWVACYSEIIFLCSYEGQPHSW